jgi:DNA-binding transcriptional LysR family regulator
MDDLNDLFFFAQVVANGGFTAAGRALKVPKSRLSRRVARLEEALSVRLIERSSRRFRVTDVGQAFYERCRNVLTEAERARAVISEAQGKPRGLVRLSCPTGLLEGTPLADLLRRFLVENTRVTLDLVATNRPVDLIEERIDIALRVRPRLTDDASLVMRNLGLSRRILVCAPRLKKKLGRVHEVADLRRGPTLTMGAPIEGETWDLIGPEGQTASLVHQPRLGSLDLAFLRDACTDGLGIALLPEHITAAARQAGKLVQLLPDWHASGGVIHMVYTARRGLPPAVRALIDHLTAGLADAAGAGSP